MMDSKLKPTDLIDAEDYPNKSVRFQNNCNHNIAIGQKPSDWDSVNFVIAPKEYQTPEIKIKWLATLEPTDIIEINFLKPRKIDP